MKKIHYAWVICGACTLLIFLTMGSVANNFSIYLPYIKTTYGFSEGQASSLITMRCVFSLAAMFIINRYYDIFNMRLGMTLSVITAAIGFMINGLSSTYLGFALGTGIAGLAYGLGGMVPVSIMMNNWFDKSRSFALGICAAGSGLAVIFLSPLITTLIENHGVSWTFRTVALCMAVSGVILFLLFRNQPEDMGLLPYGQDSPKLSDRPAAPAGNPGVPASKAMSRTLWIIMFLAALHMGSLANPGYSHLPTLFKSVGFDSMFTATLMSISGAMLMLGKILCGKLADKLGALNAIAIFTAVVTVGNILCCFAWTGQEWICYSIVLTGGLGYAVATLSLPLWTGDMVSKAHYAGALRIFQIAYALGALIFSSVPGILADIFNGSYVPAYIMFSSQCIISVTLILIGYRVYKREKAAESI